MANKNLWAAALIVALAVPSVSVAQEPAVAPTPEAAAPQVPQEADAQDQAIVPSTPVPSRFGARPADAAFGAYQRGLYITAHNLALPRAEAGDAAAQTLLAEIYSRGLGRARDNAEARKWYEKAAAQGVPEAEFRYGLILLRESETTNDKDTRQKARQLMEKSAKRGNGLAAFNMAQLVLAEKPSTAGQIEAFEYYQLAARANVADAQYALARYYVGGLEPVQADSEIAVSWLLRAAQQNYDTAQLEFGQMLLSGIGIERNYEAGFSWIRRAAVSGNVAARAELAKLYWAGIGTEPDAALAAAWFVLTRRAGYRDRVLNDFWEGLSEDTQRQAIERANQLP